jgi:chromate transporter
MSATPEPTLAAIFGRFLRFGFLAWGGPVAQIAMIKRELVVEEKWLTQQRFNRLLAIYQILPGPEAHELCVHLGMMRRGRIGGLLAGLGFMLPGLVLVLALAWLYVQFGLNQPAFSALFLGVQVGVVALIVRSVHRIGDHVLTDLWLWGISIIAGMASLAGGSFWVTLPAAGLVYVLVGRRQYVGAALVVAIAAPVMLLTIGAEGPAVVAPAASTIQAAGIGALALFWAGLKAGLLTFGGAYTAIPFVRGDAVSRGWVSDGQFLDGLALTGIIPAPLIIFATFIGYLAGGLGGALAITAGIFLPAFAFAILFFDRLELVVENERLHRLLQGVAAGVVGLIAATTLQLGASVARAVPSSGMAAALFAGSLALLYLWRSKFNVVALIPLTAAAGIMAFA